MCGFGGKLFEPIKPIKLFKRFNVPGVLSNKALFFYL